MKQSLSALGVLAATLVASKAYASDPVGIYAVIDRVIFEPSEASPERVQVWGGFAIAVNGGGSRYSDPKWGYMYFSAAPGKEEATRKEWKDLHGEAGKGDVIAFASRYKPQGTVRGGDEPPKNPDPHPLAAGLVKARLDGEHPAIQALTEAPTAPSPAPGDEVKPGKTKLRAAFTAPARVVGAKLHFEIEGPRGAKEASPPILLKAKEGEWTPALELAPGATYTWRVWAQTEGWKGTVRTMKVHVKAAK